MNNGEIEQSGGDHLPQDQDFAEFGYGGSGGSGFDWGGDWDEEEVEEVEDEDEGDEDEGEGEDLETGGGAEQQVPFDSWDDEWGAGEGPEQDNQDSYDQQAEDDIIGFLSSLASRLTIQNRSNETTSGGETMAEAVPFSRITRSEYFPDAGRVVGQGLTFLQNWRQKDAHAELRDQRPYHPFNSLDEWQFSNLLFRLPCSLNWKTELLSTSMVSGIKSYCGENTNYITLAQKSFSVLQNGASCFTIDRYITFGAFMESPTDHIPRLYDS